jgi:hypothetical protein
MAQVNTGNWQRISTAPRDGSQIYVAVRASEQGAAEVDTVSWTASHASSENSWVATDSGPATTVIYSDGELSGWMPVSATPDQPPEPPGAGDLDGGEADGSSI